MSDTAETRADAKGNAAKRLTTREGIAIDVRRASPDDLAALRAFFRAIPAEDLRFRFLETVKQVDEALLRRMVDPAGDVTFLARAAPDGALAAVATLVGAAGRRQAEVAMTTHPEWKKKGVSWTLLEHVLAFAKDQGFTQVSSLEAADNREAIALEREMGFVARLNSAEPAEILASKTL